MDAVLIFLATIFVFGSATMVRHPPFIEQPRFTHTRYVKKQSIVLKCSDTVGVPSPRYTWTWNGQNVVNDAVMNVNNVTGDLTIVNFRMREGEYQCRAHNSWGTSLSYVITLKATKKVPFSSKEIFTMEEKEGVGFTIPCVNPPKQSPPGKIKWYLTDINSPNSEIQEDERIVTDNEGNLNFAYLKESDAHVGQLYECGVFNEINEVIYLGSKTLLSVIKQEVIPETSPLLMTSSPPVVAYLGEETTLECIFSGNPVPRITWYKDGKTPISSGDVFRIESHGRHLKIKVTEKTEGSYTCHAENKLDVAQTQIYVNVKSKPIWIMAPKSMTAIEGTDVVFTCDARAVIGEKSLAPPQWYINGQLVNFTSVDESKFNFSSNKRHLAILNVSRERDLMCIQCNVSNDVGYRFKDAYLNVILPITIISRPSELIEIQHGDFIKMAVLATTDPSRTLKYEWYINGYLLNLKLPQFVLNETTKELTVDTSVVRSNETDALLGVYVCQVSHDLQTISVSVNVTTAAVITTTVSVTEEPVKADVAAVPGGSDLWVLAVVFGVLVAVVAVILIIVIVKKNNPGKTYMLGKTEVKHHLNPEKELQDHAFKQINVNM